jgi:hypothetical protein
MGTRRHPDRGIDASYDEHAVVTSGREGEAAGVTRVRQADGFQLPHPPRDTREFPTHTGKANFSVEPLQWVPVPPGRLVLQTLRSHDRVDLVAAGYYPETNPLVALDHTAIGSNTPVSKAVVIRLEPSGGQERSDPGRQSGGQERSDAGRQAPWVE